MAAQGVASVRCNRWVILAGYALLTACTQFLWLAYAPITAQTHRIMEVSEGAVGDLAGIFPFVYVVAAVWVLAGFLLLAGNLGGVVLVLIIQAAIGSPYLSLAVLSVACLAGLVLATRLPARNPRAAGAGATHQGGPQ